jgi:hypothetical protein
VKCACEGWFCVSDEFLLGFLTEGDKIELKAPQNKGKGTSRSEPCLLRWQHTIARHHTAFIASVWKKKNNLNRQFKVGGIFFFIAQSFPQATQALLFDALNYLLRPATIANQFFDDVYTTARSSYLIFDF